MFNKNNYTNNFNQFFIDYQRRFIHFASTYVHDEAVAEDFVIESIMYYWENKERLPSDINIPAYVLTVLKHKCIDYLRNQQVRQIATLEELEPNEIFTAEIQEIVNRTLETLPEQTRRIFAMSRYENKSHKEIADLLNMTTKGVEYHINKATKVLRIALKDYLPTTLLLFFLN